MREMKNSLVRYSTCQEANTPAKVTSDVSTIMESEMPSMPNLYWMLKDSYHVDVDTNSMASELPAPRRV